MSSQELDGGTSTVNKEAVIHTYNSLSRCIIFNHLSWRIV